LKFDDGIFGQSQPFKTVVVVVVVVVGAVETVTAMTILFLNWGACCFALAALSLSLSPHPRNRPFTFQSKNWQNSIFLLMFVKYTVHIRD
jgi:hypothetical protein